MKLQLHSPKNPFQSLHGKVKQMMTFGGVLKKQLVVIKVGNRI
jgi:hypothetical protein